MDMSMEQKLQMSIDAEANDSALYWELSKMTEDEVDRQLPMELAEDEHTYAETFRQIYRRLTGRSYNPMIKQPALEGSFEDILRDRVLDESGDFRKYGEQYLLT